MMMKTTVVTMESLIGQVGSVHVISSGNNEIQIRYCITKIFPRFGEKCSFTDECLSSDDCNNNGECVQEESTRLPR